MPAKEAKQDPKARLEADALYARIYAVTRQIPKGQVATYGQIGLVADVPSARMVGRAMAILPPRSKVPWHRVLNSQGKISLRSEGGGEAEQQRRLRAEGVLFDGRGRVDFAEVGWTGPSWQWLEREGYDVEMLALKSQRQPRRGPWRRWAL